jgi:peptidoglycan hydrolase CwlO-like protein
MIEDIKTIAIITSVVTQMFVAVNVVNSNRMSINELKRQHQDLKEWIKQLQDKVNDIRVKVGI